MRLFESNSAFIEVAYSPEWANMIETLKYVQKVKKLKKSCQSNFQQFSEKPGHVFKHLICQTKSPILSDKWSKGF